MTILNAHQISKSFGPRCLFNNASLVINEGEKVGVLGVNGSGKTTLFKILTGQMDPDEGKLSMRRDTVIGYLAQSPVFQPEDTPRSIVAEALTPVREAIEKWTAISDQIADAPEEQQEALIEAQGELLRIIDERGGWAWEHQVESYLQRVGMSDHLDAHMTTLSGGQHRRVALAKILLSEPDLLILDEPTNHLDADTIEWLEGFLTSLKSAILMVTHDRYFLDHIVTRIIEVDHVTHELHSHPGSYSAFMNNKIERLRLREQAEDRRSNLLRTELEWLRRGPKARGTKAKARVQRAEALKIKGPSAQEDTIKVDFKENKKLVGRILEVEGLAKSYDDLALFRDVNFILQRGDKVGLVGANGTGKSTLIRILMGEEPADKGEFQWGKNARPGLLNQQRTGLKAEDTVLEALAEADMLEVGERKVHKRTFLREFLFEREQQHKKVLALSGGELCRLLLAKLILEGSNFLILDEPTNDLDINSLQILEHALIEFMGCAVIVSHDRYFLNKVCNVIFSIEDNTIVRYDGDYNFYRKRKAQADEARKRREAELTHEAEQLLVTQGNVSKSKKLSWKERQELENIEGQILELETQRDEIETKLGDPELYRNSDPSMVAAISDALDDANLKINDLYERWEVLESRA